ncbi:MAG TPA: caspase family protein, partial [Cytophagales bacterium]|nr:caspase family protein [Cytophagales bacterium]
AITANPDGKSAVLFVKIPQKNIHLLDEVKISHNGKKLTQSVSHQSDSTRSLFKTVKINVNLISGLNVFEVHPVSKNKIESRSSQIKIFTEKAQHETNCHIFAIGINNYANANMKLRYAKADAQSFVQKFSESSMSLFKNIYVHELYDGVATRKNIMDSLERLSRSVATHDVLVFYYAGHGSMVEDMFYLIPQDCQRLFASDKLEYQGISARELQDIFKKIKALKQLVILDACQSGGSISTLALRGAGEEKAMAQLSRSAGVHIFASAGTEQSAKEIEQLKHGLFTYVLIRALSGEADGSPHDQKVTVYELKSYLDDQVPELNKQYNGSVQYPYTFSLGQDFPLTYTEEPKE